MALFTWTLGTAIQGSPCVGTLNVLSSSTAVTGSGTTFTALPPNGLTDAGGQPLTISVGGILHSIASITNDTTLTLQTAASWSGGSAFTAGLRNFATLADWNTALTTAVTTNDYTANLYNDSVFAAAPINANFSTPGTSTLTIQAAPGQSFRDQAGVRTNALWYNSANGVSITGSGTLQFATACRVNLKGVQVFSSSGAGLGLYINGVPSTVDDCILIMHTVSTAVQTVNGATALIRNSLIGSDANFGGNLVNVSSSGDSLTLDFCDVVSPTDSATNEFIQSIAGSTINCNNCAFFGPVSAFNGAGGTYTFTNCMTNFTGTVPSGVTGSIAYSTSTGAQFTGITIATADYRINSGSSLQGAASADATNGANDISGLARPQSGKWDIGAWEIAIATGVPVWLYFGQSIALGAAARLARDLIRNPTRSRRRFLTGDDG